MRYRKESELHVLSLDKDELIMLIALLHEGLERIAEKKAAGDRLAATKYDGAQWFVDELNTQIMRS